MARLTKKDFQWLATEIAPLLADGTLDEFTSSVRKHSKNGRFQKDKFMHVAWASWNAANADKFMADAMCLDAMDIDDHIPYLEDHHGANSEAA